MKMALCSNCRDGFVLAADTRNCTCGLTKGRYIDTSNVTVTPTAIVVGISNHDLLDTIVGNKPMGEDIRAFTLAEDSPTISYLLPHAGAVDPRTAA